MNLYSVDNEGFEFDAEEKDDKGGDEGGKEKGDEMGWLYLLHTIHCQCRSLCAHRTHSLS
jgi:hypothetical protein